MSDFMDQFSTLLRSLPLSKKISIVFVLLLVIAGFAFMFIWTNQTDYQVLFSNLSPSDGGAIVSKLKEKNVPYKLEGSGTILMVPAEKVYELRLALAGENLPNGGDVGFEIFDHTDFRTTKFVQNLNYRRALQGELARTINQFKEVRSSRVFIVIPKETLFVEDSKPASASIQLDLGSKLPSDKLYAITHLVANAVEGLDPDHVTVVDTNGRLIFKGGNEGDTGSALSNAQLEYKEKVEDETRKNVQSMLEGIVGTGKAIVRVNAEINFDKITSNAEEYDPATTVVRSRKNIEESSKNGEGGGVGGPSGDINRKRGVMASVAGENKIHTKKDITTNYEINKVTRTIFRPAGEITRLSVAAVIDGVYKLENLKDGTKKKVYVPRTNEELRQFEEIVKKAMGYNEDREDQVSVSSMKFADTAPIIPTIHTETGGFDILGIVKNYRKIILNLFLVLLVFIFVVRPLLRSMKNIKELVTFENSKLPALPGGHAQIPESGQKGHKEKALEISKGSPEKAQQLIKGWLSE